MLNGCSLCLVRLSAARLMTCYLPRRAPINGLRNRIAGAPAVPQHHFAFRDPGGLPRREPVALTLTALAPQLFRELIARSPVCLVSLLTRKPRFWSSHASLRRRNRPPCAHSYRSCTISLSSLSHSTQADAPSAPLPAPGPPRRRPPARPPRTLPALPSASAAPAMAGVTAAVVGAVAR